MTWNVARHSIRRGGMGTERGSTANSQIPEQTTVTDERGIWLVCNRHGRRVDKRATVAQRSNQHHRRRALGDRRHQNGPISGSPQVEYYRSLVQLASPLGSIRIVMEVQLPDGSRV